MVGCPPRGCAACTEYGFCVCILQACHGSQWVHSHSRHDAVCTCLSCTSMPCWSATFTVYCVQVCQIWRYGCQLANACHTYVTVTLCCCRLQIHVYPFEHEKAQAAVKKTRTTAPANGPSRMERRRAQWPPRVHLREAQAAAVAAVALKAQP